MKKITFLVISLLSMVAANAQLPNYVPTNGLIGFWPFTGNANDASGNGHNGIVSGAVLDADRNGVANACYRFNGTSDVINVPPTGITDLTRFTVSAWVKYTGNANMSRTYDAYFQFGTISTHTLTYGYDNIVNTLNIYHPCKTDFLPNKNLGTDWHNIVIVDDSNVTSTYIDGTLFDLKTYNTAICYKGTNNLLFGATPGDLQWMTGSLDDIGMWNRALSAQEVKNIYSGFPQSISSNKISDITISPNPAISQLIINSAEKNLNYLICNLLGQPVLAGNLNNQNAIEVSHLPTGNYLLKLNDQRNIYNYHFIKQ